MLRALVPAPLDDFAGVGLVFLDCSVSHHSNVVVDIKVEQRPGLAAGFVGDKVVEGVVVWDNKILLDVHQVIYTNTTQLWELLPTLLQKRPNIISLRALSTTSTCAKFESQV